MSLSRKTISYEDDVVRARVTVQGANVLRGLLRSQLTDEGLRAEDSNPLIHIARWTQYPAIVAGTVGGEIQVFGEDKQGQRVVKKTIIANQISFEDWLNELPETLTIDWLEAVFEVNPHWLLDIEGLPDPDTAEGKG